MYPQYTNPINDFYFRNSQPQINFPPQNVPQIPQINSRFVTNVEEARAAMIDPLSYNLFLDTNNGKIYLKKLGNNGQSDFHCYLIEENRTVDPMNEINTRLTNIENFIGELRNESVSSNASVQKSEPVSQPTVTESYEPNGSAESTGFPKNARNDKWKK